MVGSIKRLPRSGLVISCKGVSFWAFHSMYRSHFVPWREVVLFSEVTNVLSLWEVGIWGLELVLCSEVVLFSEAPLSEVLL